MINYIIRRCVVGLVMLVLISFVVYGLIRNMPGTPLTLETAETDPSKKISKEDLIRITAIYGLDKPWYQAYFQWLGNVVRGDLGRSFHHRQPVAAMIVSRIGPTLLLSITSLILAYGLAIPLGIYAAARSGKLDERSMSTVLYMLYSFPSFVAGLLLLIVFYLWLDGTPFQLTPGMTSPNFEQFSLLGKLLDIAKHMILPVIVYTYGGLAYDTRFVKSNLNEVLRQDYMRTARSKGLSSMTVLVKHGFRNTLIPFVTMLGMSLPALLSGAVILESLFKWPGMGLLFFEAIGTRDYPLTMGLTLMFAVLTLLGNLLADILYAFVDPRISYS